jgi:hypothetical protein
LVSPHAGQRSEWDLGCREERLASVDPQVARREGEVRGQHRHPGRRALLRLVLDRELDAPAEVVWAHLTTAQGLVRWVGPEAVADPTPDGA